MKSLCSDKVLCHHKPSQGLYNTLFLFFFFTRLFYLEWFTFVLNAANTIFSFLAILLSRIHTDMSDNWVFKFSPPLRVINYVGKKDLHKTKKTAIQKNNILLYLFTIIQILSFIIWMASPKGTGVQGWVRMWWCIIK